MKIKQAIRLAKHYHKNQLRDGGKEYISHLENVHHLLKIIGANVNTQIAGILHDVLEDTDCKEKLIKDKFGSVVLGLVKEVTKNPQTKLFPIKSKNAWLIKFCDIIDNCTDMKSWNEKRIRKYLEKKRIFLQLK